MDLNTGKDGTVTVVDGRLFQTGINRAKKEYLYASTKEDNEQLFLEPEWALTQ